MACTKPGRERSEDATTSSQHTASGHISIINTARRVARHGRIKNVQNMFFDFERDIPYLVGKIGALMVDACCGKCVPVIFFFRVSSY